MPRDAWMNPVLAEIVATGEVLLPSGERVAVSSHIDPECGALLQRAILDARPAVAVEVGLAFGVSTLYMLDALAAVGGRLIGIDPAQYDDAWRGGGFHNVVRAGHAGIYEFHEGTSQQTLPQLAARGQRIGVGFIDGWHTFDHVLTDFFHIDRMLDTGGIVVFDDVAYPSIRRVCEFVVANRAYEIHGAVRLAPRRSLRRAAKRVVGDWLRPLCRTDRTLDAATRARIAPLEDVYSLALRKTADDARRWDHFVHF